MSSSVRDAIAGTIPSPGLTRAFPPGPDTRFKITEEYAKLVARDVFFWAWPMVNVYSRRLAFKEVQDFVRAGPVPSAPLNRVGMLTDYIEASERLVACPNQDVVYGAATAQGDEEVKWVAPERFFDELPAVLADAPPLPGEEARYAQVLGVLQAAKAEPQLREAMTAAVAEVDKLVIAPLFEFRNYGRQLPFNWSTISNEAAFGSDYFTRTAVAKSNIFVNSPNETKYFCQDLDADGTRLNGGSRYRVTFAKNQTPPVNGFWSLTLYNQFHFFAPNEIDRYSVGTKSKALKYDSDGSLTIYVQADAPTEKDLHGNWLPAPKGEDFSLYVRAYWPKTPVTDGAWTPPAVKKEH